MSTSWTLDSLLYKSFLSVQVAHFGGSMVLQPTILSMARPGNEYLLDHGLLYTNPFCLSRWQILEGAWCCSPPSLSWPGQAMSTSWTLDSHLYESFLSVQVADFGGSMMLQMARPGNENLLTLDSPLYVSFLSVQVADFGGSMVLPPTILIMARPGNEYLLDPGFSYL